MELTQWVTGTELQQKEKNKMTKSLKIALNLACPVGMPDTSYVEIRERLEDAYGIHLNEVPRLTIHRVRKELNIETTGGVNPMWSAFSTCAGSRRVTFVLFSEKAKNSF